MSLVLRIDGEDYLPIRSVRFVTSGVLEDKDVAEMIGDPETFCDADYGEIIAPFKYKPNGKLVPMNHTVFATIARTTQTPMLPPGTVVRKVAVREKYDLTVHEIWKNQQLAPHFPAWDENPDLTPAERQVVLEGIVTPRVNDRRKVLAELDAALRSLQTTMDQLGSPIARETMPGTKADWVQIFRQVAPHVQKSPATLDGYFKEMGLRWPQGGDRNTILPVRIALGL